MYGRISGLLYFTRHFLLFFLFFSFLFSFFSFFPFFPSRTILPHSLSLSFTLTLPCSLYLSLSTILSQIKTGFEPKSDFKEFSTSREGFKVRLLKEPLLNLCFFRILKLILVQNGFWWFSSKTRVEIGDLGFFGLVLGPRTRI